MSKKKKTGKNTRKPQKVDYKMMQRLAVIHEMIKDGKYPSRQDLIAACKDMFELNRLSDMAISKRTLQRDLRILKDVFGAEIAYSRRLEGYYYKNSGL